MNKKIIKEIYSMSNETLTTLTGLCYYKDIKSVVAQWVEFVEKQEIEFETWVDAWQAFEPEYKKTKKEK
jgi:hypothetical protein